MIDSDKVIIYISSLSHSQKFYVGDYEKAPAALPDASLSFLIELCTKLEVKKVFEFGSGRSTKALLNNGLMVTSLEDTHYWMNQTIITLTSAEKISFTPLVRPLLTRFLGLFPVMDWHIDAELRECIEKADLILIDSPYYTPFRESTLWTSLTFAKDVIIVLDDTRIPTLSRFCDRLVQSNSQLIHVRIPVGHTFDLIYSQSNSKLKLNHSVFDVVKGWYRYIQGLIFYLKLNKV